MKIENKINELMNKKITRGKFLKVFGMSLLAIPFLSKSVLAKTFLRKTDGTLLDIDNLGGSSGATPQLDNLSSVAINTSLISDTDNTDNLGSTSKRWKEIRGDKIFGVSGAGTLTLSNSGGLFGQADSGCILQSSGKGSFTAGCSLITSTIKATKVGTFASGYAKTNSLIESSGNGAFAQGVTPFSGKLKSTGNGSFAQGDSGGKIYAFGNGSFVQGRTGDTACKIESTVNGRGSFVQGYTQSEATIQATIKGAFAQGWSEYYSSIIQSTAKGAFAQGGAYYGSSIIASGNGSIAHGYTWNYHNITASGTGSGAFGASGSSNIQATATNAFQFGVGVNSQADSLSIGTQVRLKGTTGAPSSPRNGDIWVNGNFMYMRSNGINCKVVNNPL